MWLTSHLNVFFFYFDLENHLFKAEYKVKKLSNTCFRSLFWLMTSSVFAGDWCLSTNCKICGSGHAGICVTSLVVYLGRVRL